jgi:hypothetical protein
MAGSGQGFKINNDNLVEAMFDIKTFGEGGEGQATCGHVVTVAYKILVANNKLISEKTGSDQIAPAVDLKLPLLCGGSAVYNARITKLSNSEVIYDSKSSGNKINMKVGNLAYPVIFSYALHNKILVGTRTVIAKGRLFKSFLNEFFHKPNYQRMNISCWNYMILKII